MIAPHNGSYCNSQESTLAIFDHRYIPTTDRLHRERVAWQEQSEIETFYKEPSALIVRPNDIRRLAT
jgi:hypothetical protein